MFYSKFIFLQAEDESLEEPYLPSELAETKSPKTDILKQQRAETKAKVIDIQTGKIIESKEEEISPELQKRCDEHKEKLKEHGEILPESHFATQYVRQIVDKLPLPKQTELIFIDSESFLAYFERSAKVIVISRGLIKAVTEVEGAPEDILASIIAHEIAHSDTIQEYKKKPWEDPLDFWASTFDHGEELRADRVGAINASKAGYNPLEIIKLFKKMGLTAGRLSMSHPESIARINHLLSIVGNDEQPLTNTTKEYTPIPKNIVDWVNEPSTVYDEAEGMMNASHEELEQKLLNAKSLEEFSHILEHQKHTELAAGAKDLVNEKIVTDFYNNLIICHSLRDLWTNQIKLFKKDQKDDEAVKKFHDKFEDKSAPDIEAYKKPQLENGITLRDYTSAINMDPFKASIYITPENALLALPFRKSVPEKALNKESKVLALENIKTYNDWVKSIIQEYLEVFEKIESSMPKREHEYYMLIKQSLKTGNIPNEIFRDRHASYDLQNALKKQKESDEERAKAGRRKEERVDDKVYYELTDPEIQAKFEEAEKLQIAFNSLSFPDHSKEAQKALNELLKKQCGFNDKTAEFITRMYFAKSSDFGNTLRKQNLTVLFDEKQKEFIKKKRNEWEEILNTMSKEELITLLAQIAKFKEAASESVRYSKSRDLHKSIQKSKISNPFDIDSQFIFIASFGGDEKVDSGILDTNKIYYWLSALKGSVEWKIYEYGYAEEYFKEPEDEKASWEAVKGIDRAYKSPKNLNLIPEDWEILSKSEIPPLTEQAKVMAISEYLKADGIIEKIHPIYKNILNEIDHVKRFYDLDIYDWIKLIAMNPWVDEKAQKIFKHLIEDIEEKRSKTFSRGIANDSNQENFFRWGFDAEYDNLLNKLYELSIKVPVSDYKIKQTEYGDVFENTALNNTDLVMVMLKRRLTRDSKKRWKYIDAIISLIDDGFEIDLNDFYKAGTSIATLRDLLGDLGRASFEDLEKLRKKLLKYTHTKPKFSELLKLVDNCPRELKDIIVKAIDEGGGSEELADYLTKEFDINDRINFIKKNISNRKLKDEYMYALWKRLSPKEKDKFEKFFQRIINLADLCSVLADTPTSEREEVAELLGGDFSIAPWKYIDHLLVNHSVEESIHNIVKSMLPSRIRDNYLIAIWERLDDKEKIKYCQEIESHFFAFTDDRPAKESAGFDFKNYETQSAFEYKSNSHRLYYMNRRKKQVIGEGFLAGQFEDLMLRRYSFSTASGDQNKIDPWAPNSFEWDDRGSAKQGFMAHRLLHSEDKIFDPKKNLIEKTDTLIGLVKEVTVVRDAYLEKLFLDEVKEASNETIIKTGDILLPLFTKDSNLKAVLAIQVLQAEMDNNPKILKDFNKCLELIFKYMPTASLARNHYLDLLEKNAKLTPGQIREMEKCRVTSEGKREKQGEEAEFSPAFAYALLGEQDRTERSKTLLWLLGIKDEKPKKVLQWEYDYNGHANSMPKAFAALTPPEQLVIVKRMCEDAEGVLDLQAVGEKDLDEAKSIRSKFLNDIAAEIFKGEGEEFKFFRNVLVNILTEANPTRGTQILSRLITMMIKNKKEGKEIDVPTMATIMLAECGIIGKKVGQGIAGIPYIKEKYPDFARALTETQSSDTNIVPKRALVELANAEGLIDGSAGIKILTFDKYLGAASNKQACLVTVEITNEQYGKVGNQMQVVAKFKRPSAQKESNIEGDFKLAKAILDTVKSQHIPEGFLMGIEFALKKELIFKDEKEFSEKLKADIRGNFIERPYEVDVSDIVFAGNDVILETLAEGVEFKDILSGNYNKKRYGELNIKEISKTIFTEAVLQLLVYGHLHADLHPGNFFATQDKITLIDKGMHEYLDADKRLAVLTLLASLISGTDIGAKKALRMLGCDTKNLKLELKMPVKFSIKDMKERFRSNAFIENINKLFIEAQKVNLDPSVVNLIYAISKLAEYTERLDRSDIIDALKLAGGSYAFADMIVPDKIKSLLDVIGGAMERFSGVLNSADNIAADVKEKIRKVGRRKKK